NDAVIGALFKLSSLARQSRTPAYSTSMVCVGVVPRATAPKLTAPGFNTISARALAVTFNSAVELYWGELTVTVTLTSLAPVKRRASMVTSMDPVPLGSSVLTEGVAVTQPHEMREMVTSRGTA